jgi:DNA polymerase-3 subunit epsilon
LITKRQTFAIVDKGRTFDEYSCVWIEKGHFYGMGYIQKSETIYELTDLKNFVTPNKSNNYIMQLINNYALKYPKKVKYSVSEML